MAWAERFVATPSVSRDGNEAIARAAAELLEGVGGRVRLEPNEYAGSAHYTVIADFGSAPEGHGLLLLTHLDTVPPGDLSAWTATGGDPWKPVRDGDRLYGLGSADAKVDLVCKAAALEGLDPARLRRPLRVVGTFAEEIGLVGARWLVERGLLRGFQHALVGEPSELCAIRAHKGYAVFEARVPLEPITGNVYGTRERRTVTGRSAHSSTPQLGRNAIEAAIEMLAHDEVCALLDLRGGGAINVVPEACELDVVIGGAGGRELEGAAHDPAPLLPFLEAWRRLLRSLESVRDADFDPAFTVGSLGRIELREGVAVLGFDLRSVPGVDAEEAVRALAPVAEVRCVRRNPALATPLDAPLLRAVTAAQASLGLGERVGTKATCTEAGVLSAAGLDVLVLGAGVSVGNVHRPNEYTRISQLEQARELYRSVVTRICVEDAACSC